MGQHRRSSTHLSNRCFSHDDVHFFLYVASRFLRPVTCTATTCTAMQKELHLHSRLSTGLTDLSTGSSNSLTRNSYRGPKRQQQQYLVQHRLPNPWTRAQGPSNLVVMAGCSGHTTSRGLPHLRLTHHQVRGCHLRRSIGACGCVSCLFGFLRR